MKKGFLGLRQGEPDWEQVTSGRKLMKPFGNGPEADDPG